MEISENIFVDMFKTFVDAFSGQIMILSGLYILVFLVVLLDLWAGIRKAKQRGEFRSSYGLRKTVEKLARYFNMMLVLTVIDAMQMLAVGHLNPQVSFSFPTFPFLTIIGAIFVGIIEFKSIYEKNSDKEKGKCQDAVKLFKQVAKNKEAREIISNVAEYLKTEDKNNIDG